MRKHDAKAGKVTNGIFSKNNTESKEILHDLFDGLMDKAATTTQRNGWRGSILMTTNQKKK